MRCLKDNAALRIGFARENSRLGHVSSSANQRCRYRVPWPKRRYLVFFTSGLSMNNGHPSKQPQMFILTRETLCGWRPVLYKPKFGAFAFQNLRCLDFTASQTSDLQAPMIWAIFCSKKKRSKVSIGSSYQSTSKFRKLLFMTLILSNSR